MLLVYDVTNRKSFADLTLWLEVGCGGSWMVSAGVEYYGYSISKQAIYEWAMARGAIGLCCQKRMNLYHVVKGVDTLKLMIFNLGSPVPRCSQFQVQLWFVGGKKSLLYRKPKLINAP